MNEQSSVSRRSSLKSLGAMGAAMILGRAAAASPLPEEPNAEETKPADEATNAVDVAGPSKKGYTWISPCSPHLLNKWAWTSRQP